MALRRKNVVWPRFDSSHYVNQLLFSNIPHSLT